MGIFADIYNSFVRYVCPCPIRKPDTSLEYVLLPKYYARGDRRRYYQTSYRSIMY